MKVVVIGGYGVFGGRLAQLLLRDGHEVWIAGRNLQKAEKWAARHGGRPLQLDLSQGLAPIKEVAPRALVDAAGPFQTRNSDPYRVVRFCIEHRINYLDLSDDPAFTAGIQVLDPAAKATGCFALSGASSLPAISSAAVAEIAWSRAICRPMARAMTRMRGSMGATAAQTLSFASFRSGLATSVSGRGGGTLVWNHDCRLIMLCATNRRELCEELLLPARRGEHQTRPTGGEKQPSFREMQDGSCRRSADSSVRYSINRKARSPQRAARVAQCDGHVGWK